MASDDLPPYDLSIMEWPLVVDTNCDTLCAMETMVDHVVVVCDEHNDAPFQEAVGFMHHTIGFVGKSEEVWASAWSNSGGGAGRGGLGWSGGSGGLLSGRQQGFLMANDDLPPYDSSIMEWPFVVDAKYWPHAEADKPNTDAASTIQDASTRAQRKMLKTMHVPAMDAVSVVHGI